MFSDSEASVILFTGGSASRGVCLQDGYVVLISSGGHRSGRYASYWNTFFFKGLLHYVIHIFPADALKGSILM